MVRRESMGYYTGVQSQAQCVIDRWISVEEKVETRIKSFRDPTEPMNPGLLYTGISALTTSVLTRSRALPTRILLPPAALVGAFTYFLPGTTSRVGAYAEELEDRYIPRIGEIRRTSIALSGIGWERVKEGAAAGRESVNNGVKSILESIEEGTGLKLKAMGWAQEVKKEAQSVASVAQKDIKEAVESKSSSGDSEDSKSLA
ncbi:apolipo protein O-domain-containing protein [Suillus ampliporus]|nr:apolipo protein O-domain-containing protein [Suillus ampliporus]